MAPLPPVGGDELDELVRDAMKGGDVAPVAEALAGRGDEDPGARLERLASLLQEARDAWSADDGARALDRVQAASRELQPTLRVLRAAEQARRRLHVEPGDILSRPRLPLALIVDPPGDEFVAEGLAAALRIDLPTARLHAVERHPVVALRGGDREALEAARARVREQLGLASVVASWEDYLGLGVPRTALGLAADGRLMVADEALWLHPPAPGHAPKASPVDVEDLRLVVAGEVSVRRFRRIKAISRGGSDTLQERSERRRVVVDLHGPGFYIRLVEGVTDTAGLPGHQPGAARKSLHDLPEHAWERWPMARVVGWHLARPAARAVIPEEGDMAVASGWPLWEEHSRTCRLLAQRAW